MTLNALETGLHKIKDSLTRKQIYFMLLNMIRSNDTCGSQAMAIITNNIEHETAEDILAFGLQQVVPLTISKYLPVDSAEEVNLQLFKICQGILESGRFKEYESTQ